MYGLCERYGKHIDAERLRIVFLAENLVHPSPSKPVIMVQSIENGKAMLLPYPWFAGTGALASGIFCPIPWCGRALLKYITYSRITPYECCSPKTKM